MKKLIVFSFVWLMLLSLAGCNDTSEDFTYGAYSNGYSGTSPILFLQDNGTYSFSASIAHSFALTGEYEIDGNTLTLTGKEHKYTFEISNNTLVLDLENSENSYFDIQDGTVFSPVDLDELIDQYEDNGDTSPSTKDDIKE